ncbi:redoxin family protein [Pedobacter sp. KR3-3]|uniref:Redoxin family protein n=1 Tax=Pedobacter albus TaxID=3113905 RepID=A0ABU7I4D9_9SPHI|nr:redoxin family protein [Pedobacter sp. KR3-3]MEE1944322.1 redoxin family protein [Pedobacter sp. KR3-3]
MKKMILMALLLGNVAFAQVKKGEQVPNFKLETILNAPVKTANLQQFKGKLVWIEFWATWCGACIEAMPHLQQLQNKYKDRLQVINVTQETAERTKQFMKARPSKLWYAIDTAGKMGELFPHRLIPHSALISPDGKLIAVTNPESITEKVIDSLLANQQVHLPEKKDNLTADYIKTYFFAEDTVRNRLVIQPEIKGGPGMRLNFMDQPAFAGRRLTFINVGIGNMYQEAFGSFGYGRTINKVDDKEKQRYCLDIIVPQKEQLFPSLKAALAKQFGIKASIQKQDKEVYVLKIVDQGKFGQIKRNTSGNRTYFSMHGKIDQQSITMTDFADYLETFGVYKSLVVDETGNNEKLDIKFSFQPEKPETLNDILKDMGLGLEKANRKVDFLVLEK